MYANTYRTIQAKHILVHKFQILFLHLFSYITQSITLFFKYSISLIAITAAYLGMNSDPVASQLSSLPGSDVNMKEEENGEKKNNLEELPQTLEQQESMKISGSNARHMVMQKLMRKSEVHLLQISY